MGLFSTLFGGSSDTKAKGATATAGKADTPEQLAQATQGASENMQNYDSLTAADTAGGAAATMQRAQDAARGTAASQSDQAIAQAAKSARTSGMTAGQAALAGSAQAATSYGTGMQQGTDQFNQNVNREAQLGQSMNERLQNAANTQASINESNASNQTQASIATAGNKTSASNTNASKTSNGILGGISQAAGAVSGVGSLFSDRRLKDKVKRTDGISDSLAKIKGYAYKYKGSSKPETGVMAQDLEKTAGKDAVYNTAQGKAIDTDRLSTINTAAIGEQGRRIKDIEKMISELRGVRNG